MVGSTRLDHADVQADVNVPISSPIHAGREELSEDVHILDDTSDMRGERDWDNAQNDDYDRRDAREDPDTEMRDYDRDGRNDRDDRGSRYAPPRRGRGDDGHAPPPSRRYDDRDRDRDRGRDRAGYPPAPPRARGPPPSRPSPSPSNIVGAFGLSIRTTERDLEDEFGRIGPVEKVVIVYDARTGRSRGFGFVTMRDVESATEAVKQLNDLDLHGRRIRVDFSSTSRAHDPTPGEYRGNPRPVDDRPPRTGSSYRGSAYVPGDRGRDRDDRGYDRGYGRGGYGRDRGDDRYDRYPRDRDDRYGGDRYDRDRYPRDRDDRDRYPRDRDDRYGGDRYGGRDDRYARGRDDRFPRDRYSDHPRTRDDRGEPRGHRRGAPSDAPDWRRGASPVRGSSPPPRARSRSPGMYRDDDRERGDYRDERETQDRYADTAPRRDDE